MLQLRMITRTAPAWPPLATLLLVLAAHAVPAAAAAQSGVRGRVLDAQSGEPLATTAVALIDAQQNVVARAVANTQGVFFLSAPTGGEYRIEAQRIGYTAALLGPVRVEADRLTELQVRLAPDAIPMDALIVASERQIAFLQRQGFYERRRSGFGRFLDRYQIESRGIPQGTVDLLVGMPGVRIVYTQAGERLVVMRGGVGASMNAAYCAPRVVLDGIEVRDFNVDQDIRPHEIEAIEVYASGTQAPARFGGLGAACGVIVLWRRI
jgi:hypothetical protein